MSRRFLVFKILLPWKLSNKNELFKIVNVRCLWHVCFLPLNKFMRVKCAFSCYWHGNLTCPPAFSTLLAEFAVVTFDWYGFYGHSINFGYKHKAFTSYEINVIAQVPCSFVSATQLLDDVGLMEKWLTIHWSQVTNWSCSRSVLFWHSTNRLLLMRSVVYLTTLHHLACKRMI
jgi:hypothetical protein